MVDVYFYNITKRLNSTARPASTGTKYECVFKDSTSILNPVLKLRLSTKPDYNYFKFDNRYYWITDIISLHDDLWQIFGRVDVLATFKGHIQATRAFVLYDSTANTQLPDSRLAVKTDCDTYTSTANMPWSFSSGVGSYLIATTGDPSEFDFNTGTVYTNSRAGSGVYMLPKSAIEKVGFDVHDVTTSVAQCFSDMLTQLQTDLAMMMTLRSDILEQLLYSFLGFALVNKSLVVYPMKFFKILAENLIGGGSALSNVKASYWLPFVIPSTAYSNVNKPLALGSFGDDIPNLKSIDDPVITSLAIPITIPWHYTDWRNTSCTEVMLYIPMIGCINIPSAVVKGQSQLTVTIALNIYSGSMAAEVKCNGGQIGTYGAQVAMPYLIGDSNINMASLFNTVVNAAAENYAGMVSSGMQTLNAMATSVGGIGGGAGTGLTNQIVCICRCHDTSQDPSALIGTIGTPTHQLKTLSGSGYCQTVGAQMSGTAVSGEPDPTQTELENVNNMLNTGVYLE